MIYGEVDFSTYVTVNMRRSVLPNISITERKIPGRPGTRFRKTELEPLIIPVNLRLKANPDEDMSLFRHSLAEILYSNEPKKLVLPDEPTLYYMAVLRGASELSNLWYTGSCDIEMYCNDPIAYGQTYEEDIASNIGIGGTWPTKPIITCYPKSGSYHRITNQKTGEHIQITRTFAGTETIVYDCEREQATVNGVNVAVNLASDYFELEPGNNTLLRSSGTGTIEWTERWL